MVEDRDAKVGPLSAALFKLILFLLIFLKLIFEKIHYQSGFPTLLIESQSEFYWLGSVPKCLYCSE